MQLPVASPINGRVKKGADVELLPSTPMICAV